MHDPVGDVLPPQEPGDGVQRVVPTPVASHHHHPAAHRRGRVAELFHHRHAPPHLLAREARQALDVPLRKSGGQHDVVVDGDRRGHHHAVELVRPEHRAIDQIQCDQPVLQGRHEDTALQHRGRPLDGHPQRHLPGHGPGVRVQRAHHPVQVDGHQESVGDHRTGQGLDVAKRGDRPTPGGEEGTGTLGGEAGVGGVEPGRSPVHRPDGAGRQRRNGEQREGNSRNRMEPVFMASLVPVRVG